MKLLRNLSLGVAVGALTAAGVLLGVAQPAAAQAPPGFFQIPGTKTAILFTGQVGTRGILDTKDYNVDYPGLAGIDADILIPLFIPAHDNVSHLGGNNNGGFHFSARDFSFGFITTTPTLWGNLGTTLILGAGSNLNDPAGFSQAFQNVGVVVAFGTLGPWEAGMNGTLMGDSEAAPDTMGEPLGLPGQLGGIQPGIRYTWVGPNGFSLAGALEQSFTGGVSAAFIGNFPNQLFTPSTNAALGSLSWGPDAPWSSGTVMGTTTWPDLIVKAQLDQPWGHVALGGMIHNLSSSCTEACDPGTSSPTGTDTWGDLPNYNKVGWALNLTGHFNTWGKDTLKWGAFVGQGVDHYMGDYGGNQGMEIGMGPTCGGGTVAAPTWCGAYIPTDWGLFGAYQHFWTEQLRSTVGAGYDHVGSSNAYQTTPSATRNLGPTFVGANVDNVSHWSVLANLIWSPVPKVDLGVQYLYYHVTYLTNDSGVVNGDGNGGADQRFEFESIFHF
ncbi:MAG: hypothetical protein ACREFD_11130 [Stellaceae bacterium]